MVSRLLVIGIDINIIRSSAVFLSGAEDVWWGNQEILGVGNTVGTITRNSTVPIGLLPMYWRYFFSISYLSSISDSFKNVKNILDIIFGKKSHVSQIKDIVETSQLIQQNKLPQSNNLK